MLPLEIIPSHLLAQWLLGLVKKVISPLGLEHNAHAQEIIYVIFIVVIALALGYGLRKLVLLITTRMPVFKLHRWGQHIAQLHTLESCTHFIAPLVFLCMVPFAFDDNDKSLKFLDNIALIYLIISITVAICAILKLEWVVFNDVKNTKNLPLKGVLNVCRGIVWIIAVVLVASVLIGESPMSLLAGLGALSAAILLIFHDTILGLVATLQLSSNDMIRVGDWIEVPGTPANGTVTDVTLSAVKILNWDNTTAMLSPYKLVSGSFQNYRSMQESGARRILSVIYIDPLSVKESDAELFKTVAEKFPIMQKAIALASAQGGMDLTREPLQSGMKTNLGLFRAYAFAYLQSHPRIAQDQYLLVNLLDEVEFGIPVQFFCFTNTSKWIPFEQIHDEVLEHFYSAIPVFGLSLCNYASFQNKVTISSDSQEPEIPEKASQTPAPAKPDAPEA